MKQVIPLNVFERLEREWRMIDPQREPLGQKSREDQQVDLPRRLKVGRFDDATTGQQ